MKFERSRTIPAPTGRVWEVVANPSTLPAWLVRTTEANQPGPDVVHLNRLADGHPYELEGLYRARPEQRRVEWGSRGVGDYAGWLQLHDEGDERCEITLHLSFLGGQPEAHAGPVGESVDEDLDRSLERLAALFGDEQPDEGAQ